MRHAIILSSFVLLASAPAHLFGADYLTKDGKLAQPLKVVQLQGGFAGFTGIQFAIAPDGSWTSANVFNEKLTPKDKGQLSAKELAKLAAALEKYDLAKLPEKSGVAPGANPHTLSFEFGKSKANLIGQVPPKLNPKNPSKTIESRFAGIWEEVAGLLTPPTKEK
jgi:hypothetical protein